MRLTSSPAHFDLRRPVQENWLLLSKIPRCNKAARSGREQSGQLPKAAGRKSEIRRQAELCPPACKFAQSGTGSDGAAFATSGCCSGPSTAGCSAPGRTPKKLQQQTALVRAELYRAGISAKDDAGATARLARETSRYNRELSKQEARLKRLGKLSAG